MRCIGLTLGGNERITYIEIATLKRPQQMDVPPDPLANAQSRINPHFDVLRTDVRLCFTFTDLAATSLKMGNREAAEQAIADAEKGYATVRGFLSDPKHSKHLTEEQIRDLTSELERLRKRID